MCLLPLCNYLNNCMEKCVGHDTYISFVFCTAVITDITMYFMLNSSVQYVVNSSDSASQQTNKGCMILLAVAQHGSHFHLHSSTLPHSQWA